MSNKITKTDRDDAHRICRSCLCKSSELISLEKLCSQINTIDHGLADCHETIANSMMSCANIQVDVDDGLPQNICRECFIDISAAIVYRRKCEESDKELRQIFLDDFLNVSVKVETDNDPSAETYATSQQNWFEIVDTETRLEGDNEPFHDDSTNHSNASENILDQEIECIPTDVRCESAEQMDRIDTETRSPAVATKPKRRKHVCDICSKEFKRLYNMQVHLKIHAGVNRFTCDICQRVYKTSKSLVRHKERHKKMEENQKLAETNNDITYDSQLRRRVFRCDVCQKSFRTLNNLHQHELVHTNVRRFTCDICKRQYKTKNHIKYHMRIHRDDTSDLYPHLCTVCGKRFQSASWLSQHMLKHTGERPFKCDLCGRGFTTQTYLKYHMMMHNGDRPHRCNVCNATYVRLSSLTDHMKSHSGTDYKEQRNAAKRRYRQQVKLRKKFVQPKMENILNDSK